MNEGYLESMLDFLGDIGLSHSAATLSGTRLPGLRIANGELRIDSDKLTWPGDILYMAGLIAVMPPSRRTGLSCDEKPDAGHELPAMAWAYAASVHLGIDPTVVFHEGGYQGAGGEMACRFQGPRAIGVPMLVWLGLCDAGGFPTMNSWILKSEAPS